MTYTNHNETPADEGMPPAPDAGASGVPASGAAAIAEANRALQAAMEELREARDRLCDEADEFELRVKERTAELEAIISSLPDAVYIGDEDGIFRCNQAALDYLGCENIAQLQAQIPVLNEKLQNRYADTHEPIAPEDEAFAKALRGQPWTYEVISRNLRTGEDVIQRCAANPIVLDGEVVGAVAINTDITQQKRTEQALRETIQRLSEREAALVETAEKLQATQDQLETRVAERTAALEASEAQLRTLTHRLVQVQEAERRTLARDLHDTAGQAMTLINMGLAVLKRESGLSEKAQARIEELRHAAGTVTEDLHRLSVNLRPSSLDRYGLVPAIEDLINRMRKQAAIEVDFRVEGLDERLPGDLETALYRIVQEATTNITRYAAASHASVSLRRGADTVSLEVADNGRGFNVEEALRKGRLGLLGMRERAEILSSAFDIESSPERGTVLSVRVPLSANTAGQDGDAAPIETATADLSLPFRGRADTVSERRAEDVAYQAAELARAKALSDSLVDITAGMVRQETTQGLLAFVLARSAEAIGCDFAIIGLHEDDRWVISQGYQLPEFFIGQRLTDAALPLVAELERTGEILVLNDAQGDDPLSTAARRQGVKTGAGIPLISGGSFLGLLAYIHSSAAIPFTPSEVEFLQRLAGLISLALDNLHLHEVEGRQRAELAQRVEELQALFAVLPVGIAITHDPLCKRIEVNDMLAETLGTPPGENASMSADEDERPTNFKLLHEGREMAAEEMPMQVAAGQGREVHDVVMEVDRADGDKRVLVSHAVPLRAADGMPRGAVGAFVDVTDYVRAREQAQQTAQTLDALLQYIPEGITIADAPDVTIRYVSRYGQELLGGPHADKTAGEVAEQWTVYESDGVTPVPEDNLPLVRAVRYGETVRDRELTQVNAAGRQVPLLCSAGPIRDAEGNITGGVVAWRDMTALKRKEEQLRRSEATYRAIAQSFPNGAIYVFDRDLRYLVVEGELLPLLGQTPASMEGKTIWEAFDEPTVETIEPRYRDALAGESLHFETFYGERFGNRIISADYRPIRDQGGEIVAGLIVAQDITEQERAEESLRQANAELEAILAALPSGLIVYNPEGRIVRMNGPVRDMLGYDDEIWLKPVGERANVAVQVFRPDGTAYSPDEFAAIRALRGEEVHNEDLFIHLPDHPEKDFWALLSACPIEGAGGERLGAVVTLADTGEFHRVSQELRRANAELEAILASIPDGLIVNAVDGRVSRMNPVAEEMLRYTPEERGLPIGERLPAKMRLFRPDGTPYPYDEYPPVRALTGKIARSQELIMRSDGYPERDARVLASAGPILTEQGELLGAVTILTDISDLYETRSRLEEANAALEAQAEELREAAERLEQRVQARTTEVEESRRELQALSHRLVEMQESERSYVADQLYNQAAQVLAALKMQLWSVEKSGQHAASAAQLAEMKTALDQTIRALHDLATQLHPAALDRLTITTLLRGYVSQYVGAQGLSFRFDAGGTEDLRLPPPVATAIFRTIQEALANIGRHASATAVTLTLSLADGFLVVTLADDGVGFDPADSLKSGGVGLIGMRERIESVRGRLKIDSTPRGSTVTVAVPVEEHDQGPGAA